ncbi:hypothetical protein AKJ09_01277 [Labilithrix luteola]|uniref:Uncharacterized protein n=1 Tax=Labilithrix luteola TaxID=1391654 RepID=A0A0K1PM49_9BACT|nr:hypothetical protein [Labilithrix luteola]AKU94613.1 hypothetical protein AKJ09_01277 [Labilithrix luteola]
MKLGALAAFTLVVLADTTAWAEPSTSNECFSAPVEGQKLRRKGALLAAREQFRICARNKCPSEVVRACSRWESEVDASIPTVVLTARDGHAVDVPGVLVAIDGSSGVALGSRAIELDPGSHHFVFSRQGSADVTRDGVLSEGEKNRAIGVTYEVASAAVQTSYPDSIETRPIPATAWIFGGVGVLGIAGWATFGALYLSDRDAKHCDIGCDDAQRSSVERKGTLSEISLGVGVVSLGLATVFYLTRPKRSVPVVSTLDVRTSPAGTPMAIWSGRF